MADQLDDLLTILGPPLVMTSDWLRLAAALAYDHGLSFYDASWAATADRLNLALVITPTDNCWRQDLPSRPHTPPNVSS